MLQHVHVDVGMMSGKAFWSCSHDMAILTNLLEVLELAQPGTPIQKSFTDSNLVKLTAPMMFYLLK